MTPLRPVGDYRAIRLGTDGVVIRDGQAQAVFLPQVATETGWTLDQFLGQPLPEGRAGARCLPPLPDHAVFHFPGPGFQRKGQPDDEPLAPSLRQNPAAPAAALAAPCCSRLPRRPRRHETAEAREAAYYEKLGGEKVECRLCPHECRVADRKRGHCGVRENRGGIYIPWFTASPAPSTSTRSKKNRCSTIIPAARPFPWPRPAAISAAVSARTGRSPSAGPNRCGPSTCCREAVIRQARDQRLPRHRPHLQRAGRLLRVHARLRRPGQGTGRAQRHDQQRLHPEETDARTVPLPGRGQDRSQGLHARISTSEQCGGRLQPVLDTLLTLRGEKDLVRDRGAADPRPERLAPGDRSHVPLAGARAGARRAAAFFALLPHLHAQEHPAHAAGNAARRRGGSPSTPASISATSATCSPMPSNTYCPACGKLLLRRLMFSIENDGLKGNRCKFCQTVIPGRLSR